MIECVVPYFCSMFTINTTFMVNRSIGSVFRTLHGFNTGETGLAFLSVAVGVLLGLVSQSHQERLYQYVQSSLVLRLTPRVVIAFQSLDPNSSWLTRLYLPSPESMSKNADLKLVYTGLALRVSCFPLECLSTHGRHSRLCRGSLFLSVSR